MSETEAPDQTVYSAPDPIWIDNVWLDTVVVVGLTCFILCLMGLSKVCLGLECVTNLNASSVNAKLKVSPPL
jgi:hypothetical protein